MSEIGLLQGKNVKHYILPEFNTTVVEFNEFLIWLYFSIFIKEDLWVHCCTSEI